MRSAKEVDSIESRFDWAGGRPEVGDLRGQGPSALWAETISAGVEISGHSGEGLTPLPRQRSARGFSEPLPVSKSSV